MEEVLGLAAERQTSVVGVGGCSTSDDDGWAKVIGVVYWDPKASCEVRFHSIILLCSVFCCAMN